MSDIPNGNRSGLKADDDPKPHEAVAPQVELAGALADIRKALKKAEAIAAGPGGSGEQGNHLYDQPPAPSIPHYPTLFWKYNANSLAPCRPPTARRMSAPST